MSECVCVCVCVLCVCVGLDLLLAGSGSEVLEMLSHLADMVDDALEDARAEALTALCNLLEDVRALQLLVRSSNAMDDIISGVAFCLGTHSQKRSVPLKSALHLSKVLYTSIQVYCLGTHSLKCSVFT